MEKEQAQEIVERLIERGELEVAWLVCFDYDVDPSKVEALINERT